MGSHIRTGLDVAEIGGSKDQRQNLLAVGDFDCSASEALPPSDANVFFVGLDQVTPELLRRVEPDAVVSELISPRFDCVDVAQRLSECGYSGCLQLVAGEIPRPDLVASEMHELFPNLEVQVGRGARAN